MNSYKLRHRILGAFFKNQKNISKQSAPVIYDEWAFALTPELISKKIKENEEEVLLQLEVLMEDEHIIFQEENSFGINGLPGTYFITSKGRVAYIKKTHIKERDKNRMSNWAFWISVIAITIAALAYFLPKTGNEVEEMKDSLKSINERIINPVKIQMINTRLDSIEEKMNRKVEPVVKTQLADSSKTTKIKN